MASSSTMVSVCGFCGCQQYTQGRCTGCGAASVVFPDRAIKIESGQSVKTESKSKNYLLHFVVALIAGIVVNYFATPDQPVKDAIINSDIGTMAIANSSKRSGAFRLTPAGIRYSIADIQHSLSAISSPYEFYYAGVNRPATPHGSVMLDIQNTSANIVLVLSSFEQTHWHISNPYKVNIIAIVHSSDLGVSSINGDLSSARILPAKNTIGAFYQSRQCSCSAPGLYQCSGSDVQSMVQDLERLGSGTLTGIANRFSTSSLRVPLTTVRKLSRGDAQRQHSNELLKLQCFKDVPNRSGSFLIPE